METLETSIYSPKIHQKHETIFKILTFQKTKVSMEKKKEEYIQQISVSCWLFGIVYILCWGSHSLTSFVFWSNLKGMLTLLFSFNLHKTQQNCCEFWACSGHALYALWACFGSTQELVTYLQWFQLKYPGPRE